MSSMLSKNELRHVTPKELQALAESCRESIWEAAGGQGREPKIYLHWSAGRYGQFWNGYHVQIDGDGEIYVYGDLDDVLSHTWKRNTGAVGITLACGYEMDTHGNLGECPPTERQIERMAEAIAAVAAGLWLTIDKSHVLTHGEAADNEDGLNCHEDYGPRTTCERWDLEYLGTDKSPSFNPWATDGSRGGDVLRGKANFYRYGPPEAQEKAWQEDLGKIQKELTNEERIWRFLKEMGLNDFAVAGIMGNLYAESGLSPINLENYYESKLGMTDEEYTAAVDNGSYSKFIHDSAGYGLAQWTYWSRKQGLLEMAQGKGVSIGDLDMQLEYLWQEMLGYHGMMAKLKAATSVQEASNAVLLDFEHPADQSEAVQFARARMGQDFYDEYALTSRLGETEKEDEEMRYNTVDDVPEWARPTIQKMIDKGLLGGTSGKDSLDLSLDMIRVFVINDRAGLY